MFAKALCTVLIIILPDIAIAQDTDTVKSISFAGNAYMEANFGRKCHSDARTKWDIPHIGASAELTLRRGWSVEAEIEYERLYENAYWENDFHNNFTTNKLNVNKEWSKEWNVRAGIIPVPVGITNSEGPALTIYDPESEAAMIPMTWHDGGIILWGNAGKWDYSVGQMVYASFPLSKARYLGTSARAGYAPWDGFHTAASAYWGTAREGMIRYASPSFMEGNTIFFLSLEATYEAKGWTAGTSAIYSGDADARSFGGEIGYDLMTLTTNDKLGLIPFVRYDGVFHTGEDALNKFTIGFNFSFLKGFTLKAEYGHSHYTGQRTINTLDMGVSYSYDF